MNAHVAIRRQTLRLVIDGGEGAFTPPPSERRRVHFAEDAQNKVRTPAPAGAARLMAGRVSVDPVRSLTGGAAPALTAAGAIRREMIAASCLSADDARMILARRTSEMLEGGRVARLAPARRQKLDRLAVTLGLRPFDTSLVIAIAQDAARNAEAVEEATGRLAMVRPAPVRDGAGSAWCAAAALGLAAVCVMALIRWIVSAPV